MDSANVTNLALWIAQATLAMLFVFAGAPKILGRGLELWKGFDALPRSLVVFIGLSEVLGAAGLVLPMATGILPWLTPLAAVGLASIVIQATGFHLRADERIQAIETGLWGAIAAVIAVGRWELIATRATVPASLLVAALAVLIPSTVVIVIVLYRAMQSEAPAASTEPVRVVVAGDARPNATLPGRSKSGAAA